MFFVIIAVNLTFIDWFYTISGRKSLLFVIERKSLSKTFLHFIYNNITLTLSSHFSPARLFTLLTAFYWFRSKLNKEFHFSQLFSLSLLLLVFIIIIIIIIVVVFWIENLGSVGWIDFVNYWSKVHWFCGNVYSIFFSLEIFSKCHPKIVLFLATQNSTGKRKSWAKQITKWFLW